MHASDQDRDDRVPKVPWGAERFVGVLLSPLHLLERARGRSRFCLFAVYFIATMAIAAVSWREMSLRDLPDIGTPFDVGAFVRAAQVSNERNAFVIYQKAAEKFIPESKESPWRTAAMNLDWGTIPPEFRPWAEANGPALALWLEGTARPDAMLVSPEKMSVASRIDAAQLQRKFVQLALLEASRQIEQGDVSAAWSYYNAIVRCSRHLGQSGGAIQRLIGKATLALASPKIIAWSNDPHTKTSDLRLALDNLATADRMSAPPSEMFKVEYLTFVNTLNQIDVRKLIEGEVQREQPEWLYFLPGVSEIRWYFAHEPERSLRVGRLYFANWLSQCDKPPSERAQIAARPDSASQAIFLTGANDPVGSRVLRPEELEEWLRGSRLASALLPASGALLDSAVADQQQVSVLRLHIAQVLFEREHGQPPKTYKELLGTYLDRLPAGYEGYEAIVGASRQPENPTVENAKD